MRHVVVPWASNRPAASVTRPSAIPTRLPQFKTLPSALILPVSRAMARTSETLNSSVVLPDTLFNHRLDGETHAAIEKGRRQAAMHRPPWVKVSARRSQGDGDAPSFGLHRVTLGLSRTSVLGQWCCRRPRVPKLATHHRAAMLWSNLHCVFGRLVDAVKCG